MDKKSKVPRANGHACLSAKSKSSVNTVRSMRIENQEKNAKQKSTLEQQPSRNFRFSMSPNEAVKKEYKKNSEKMIKLPEKHGKAMSASNSVGKCRPIRRGGSLISDRTVGGSTAVRSLTQIFDESVPSSVDTKAISELEERLESLQSIFLSKVEILKNREPEKLKKEYKFIALVADNESKLVIKESDAKRFPEFLPAKSVEDLNRKAGEFFIGCLCSFVDKLRSYQENNRSINCDEIYEELKKEQTDYCCILQDWISELHDNANGIEERFEKPKTTEVHCREIQTDSWEINKSYATQEVQTDALKDEGNEKSTAVALLTIKMDKLRLENYEFKDQLKDQNESYMKKIKALEESNKEKCNELSDSLEKEKSERIEIENSLKKEQKVNSDLSLQVMDLQDELSEIRKKYEQSLNKQEERKCANSQLEKYRYEIEQLRTENRELQGLRTSLVNKLDKRYAQYELMEKEIKLQKRAIRTKTEEIEQLKNQFESKVKENRQLKDSLEARSKLIDHLRNAVEIDQKNIRELEVQLEYKHKPSENTDHEIKERDDRQKRFKTSETVKIRESNGGIFRPREQNPYSKEDISPGLYQSSVDQKMKTPQKAKERRRKYNVKLRDDETIEPLAETISINIPTDSERTPVRNVKPMKRSRDIVVKKYEL